ncbi:uncharacterized protein EDB91DRAFT_784018 [Suillus paluster]|uniref:uncharacterized protein n=1 Tax=Suillus paluster TaxID=48578 RepID=UPI001B861984|nr:uncharacterized protein EDB91DRAFT_784018 [Suillus paluster]KAG1730552.1 hypothetical protein EDB91DRAFT_784018 [Suillus paluster]
MFSKSWFACPRNGGSKLVQVIMEDGGDAHALITVVQLLDHRSHLGDGLGVAVDRRRGGYWICLMGLQMNLMAKCEGATRGFMKRLRGYTTSRFSMSVVFALCIFRLNSRRPLRTCLSTVVHLPFCTRAALTVSPALVYLSKALLFYVGTVLHRQWTRTPTSRCVKSLISSYSPFPSAPYPCPSLDAFPSPLSPRTICPSSSI